MPENIRSRDVKLERVLEFTIPQELGQFRVESGRQGRKPVFVMTFGTDREVDPWCEAFFFPRHTLRIATVDENGQTLWQRDLGPGVVPGGHFCPVTPCDLDGDGDREIWFVNNIDTDHPLSLNGRRLERLDAASGEPTGQWPWPDAQQNESIGRVYRSFIYGAKVNGQSVLVTCQGTYGLLTLQGWDPGMSKRWEMTVKADEPGGRSSHTNPIIDINEDGIDELFYGERCIELGTGKELFCLDRDTWNGHSDVIAPFRNPDTGEYLVYTCRESFFHISPRVACFNLAGERVWTHIEHGHMDMGWVANIGRKHPVAMAVRIHQKVFTPNGIQRGEPDRFTWDAVTGESCDVGFDVFGSNPFDINGDGLDEFYRGNEVLDCTGRIVGSVEGRIAGVGKYLDLPGLQLVTWQPNGTVQVWTDRNAMPDTSSR